MEDSLKMRDNESVGEWLERLQKENPELAEIAEESAQNMLNSLLKDRT